MAGRSSGMAISGRAGPGLNGLARRSTADTLPPYFPSRPLLPRTVEAPPVCELCKRESLRFTSHHLVPRSRGGKFGPQVKLCPTCHRQLHAMFSASTLAKELNSIAALRANPEFAGYLKWARHQKGPTSFRVRRAKNRR